MRILPGFIVSIVLGLTLYYFLTPAFLMFAGLAFSVMDGYSIVFAFIGLLGMFISMVLFLPAVLLNLVFPIAASGQSTSPTEASEIAAFVWPICFFAFVIWKNRGRNNAQT